VLTSHSSGLTRAASATELYIKRREELKEVLEIMDKWASVITILLAIITTLLAILSALGVFQYFIEPRLIAGQTRKKYATALWIACRELQLHLTEIKKRLVERDETTIGALKKIPDWDYKGKVDWFTKWGYYTMVTAYKIAVVSSWLRTYQQVLLFSTYYKSRDFISSLYKATEGVKSAFSNDTILWYYYFDAIGDKLICKSNEILSPITFSQFCDNYYGNQEFRLFYEQLHMFIWFIANGDYLQKIDEINTSLDNMMSFLEKQNLLTGLKIERPQIKSSEISRSLPSPGHS